MSTLTLVGIAIASLIVAGCAVFLYASFIYTAPYADDVDERQVENLQ